MVRQSNRALLDQILESAVKKSYRVGPKILKSSRTDITENTVRRTVTLQVYSQRDNKLWWKIQIG